VEVDAAPSAAAAAEGYRSPRDMLRFTRAAGRRGTDVFFFPTVYSYFPLPPGRRAVVTIHDTIVERFPELTLPGWRARLFWRLKVRLALLQSRLVLTVSRFSAEDLHRRVPRRRIRVAVEAPSAAYAMNGDPDDVEAAAAGAGLPERARWFTYVGGFNPHKRVDVLVRAHATVAKGTEDPPHLLLVGAWEKDVFHGCRDGLVGLIRELGTGGLVHWTGFVPDAELRALHRGSVACVLPSECEGFGLPAVEAAACGAAVVATTESPLPGLLEGGGLFVPPGDAGALARAMGRLLAHEDERAELGARARERTGLLSWERTARAVLDSLAEAAA